MEIFTLPSRDIVLKRVGLDNEHFTAGTFVLLLECMIATCDRVFLLLSTAILLLLLK